MSSATTTKVGPNRMLYRVYDLSICVDCLVYHANGDIPEEDCGGNHWTEEDANGGFDYVSLGSTVCEYCADGDESCEPWVSWSACDLCGCTLGGNREHATGWALIGGPTS